MSASPRRASPGVPNRLHAGHWLVGLMLFLAALLYFAPAQLLVWPVARYGAGKVTLEGLSGRIWDGRAERLEWVSGPQRQLRLEGVVWQLSAHKLFSGDAPLHLANAGGDLTLSGWVGPSATGWFQGGLRLVDFRLDAPLSSFVPQLGDLGGGVQGRFGLQADDITLDKHYAGKAQGELSVGEGSARKIPAGRYQLALEGRGERLAIRWHGPQGPRAMSGNAWWDGRLHLDGVP